jgi:hypothetical protein
MFRLEWRESKFQINIDTYLPAYVVSITHPCSKTNKKKLCCIWIMIPCRLEGDLLTFPRNPLPAFSFMKKV